MSVTTRRRLSLQEKKEERAFDDQNLVRLQRTSPYRYEEVPEHKSYLDLGVQNIVEGENSRRNIFAPRGRVYDYEVVAEVEERPAQREEFDTLKLRPEAMPSEETMKVLLEQRVSPEQMESMLAGSAKRSTATTAAGREDVFFIDEEEQSEKQAHITLNTKGKVTVAAYIAVILTMLIIALVTASSIATLSTAEAGLKEELSLLNTQIASLSAEAGVLSDEEILTAKAEQLDMYVPTEGNGLTTITMPPKRTEATYNIATNWFDAICKFFANLFG